MTDWRVYARKGRGQARGRAARGAARGAANDAAALQSLRPGAPPADGIYTPAMLTRFAAVAPCFEASGMFLAVPWHVTRRKLTALAPGVLPALDEVGRALDTRSTGDVVRGVLLGFHGARSDAAREDAARALECLAALAQRGPRHPVEPDTHGALDAHSAGVLARRYKPRGAGRFTLRDVWERRVHWQRLKRAVVGMDSRVRLVRHAIHMWLAEHLAPRAWATDTWPAAPDTPLWLHKAIDGGVPEAPYVRRVRTAEECLAFTMEDDDGEARVLYLPRPSRTPCTAFAALPTADQRAVAPHLRAAIRAGETGQARAGGTELAPALRGERAAARAEPGPLEPPEVQAGEDALLTALHALPVPREPAPEIVWVMRRVGRGFRLALGERQLNGRIRVATPKSAPSLIGHLTAHDTEVWHALSVGDAAQADGPRDAPVFRVLELLHASPRDVVSAEDGALWSRMEARTVVCTSHPKDAQVALWVERWDRGVRVLRAPDAAAGQPGYAWCPRARTLWRLAEPLGVTHVLRALRAPDGHVPSRTRPALLSMEAAATCLALLRRHVEVRLCEGAETVMEPVPLDVLGVDVDRREGGVVRVRFWVRPGGGDAERFPAGHGAHIIQRSGGQARRDVHAEREAVQRALQHLVRGPLPAPRPAAPGLSPAYDLEGDVATAFVASLVDVVAAQTDATFVPPCGVRLEPRWLQAPPEVRDTPAELVLSLLGASHYFAVRGHAQFGSDLLPLKDLLRAAREDRRFVALDTERVLELSEALSRDVARLADVVEDGEAGELRADLRLATVLPCCETAPVVDGDTDLMSLFQAWRARPEMDRRPPRALQAELRDYQKDGLAFLRRLAGWGTGGILADDMGLGKTVQCIAWMLDHVERGPIVVIAPTSVVGNWQRELERFAPSLDVIVHRGPKRARDLRTAGARSIVLTSYALLQRDGEAVLGRVDWAAAVFDEAQALKNPRTKTAGAARALRATHRLALTGTPIENNLLDLWALFHQVCPALLGPLRDFRARYADVPPHRAADAQRALRQLVQPLILRRTRADVLQELPPLTERVERVPLSTAERRVYEAARQMAKDALPGTQIGPAERFTLFAELSRLRQLACDAGLVLEDGPPSSKLARLDGILAERVLAGGKTLVFSQYTRLLKRAQARAEQARLRAGRLDGALLGAHRDALVDAFRAGEFDVLFVSLKAGGTGLNLVEADTVVLLDPWWNPATEAQAAARAHRMGQTRPVTLIRLLAEDTVESAILDLQAEKRALSEAIMEGASGEPLSSGELARLAAVVLGT